MAPRVKVFAWSDGFHRFTVAASSRPKALAAWGVSHDLFQAGLASEVTEGADRDAALASPGEVIRTGVAVDPGKITRGEKARPRRDDAAARRAKARRDELKARIADLKATTDRMLADIQAERDALDQRIADTRADADRQLGRLKRELDAL